MTSWWLGNLAEYSLQVVMLVAAGGLLPAVFRLREPRVRLVYWQMLLGCCLLLPLAQPWREPVSARFPAGFSVAASAAAGGAGQGYSWGFWVAVALIGVAAARLLWLGTGMVRLARLRTSARELSDAPIVASGDVRVCVASRLDGPVTFGWLRPVVLLPESFAGSHPETQSAVLMHELVHVERRDWLWTVAEEVIRSVLWFHPAVHWVIGQIQLTREQVVDREVVARTGGREAYLRALVEITKARVAPALSAAPAFLRRRHLKARVQTLLEDVSMTKFRTVVSLSAMAVVLTTAGIVAVSYFPLHATPQVERIGDGVSSPRLLTKVEPSYTEEARESKLQGTVTLSIEVWPDGKAHNIEVVNGIGLGLDEEAVNAIELWEFEPGRKAGQAVPVAATVEVNFRLQ